MSNAYRSRHSLPADRICCHRCGIWKPPHSFSNSRLNDVRYHLSRGARLGDRQVAEVLVCLECTGGPPVEMECQGPCGRKRALQEFSANQRNNPDDAMCRRCVAERLNVRPGPQHEQDDAADHETVQGAYRGGSSTMSGAPSTMDNGVSLNESVQFTSVAPAQRSRLTNTRMGVTGSSGSVTASSAATGSNRRPPPVEVGASGFAKVRAGFREEPVPVSIDDGVDLASDDDDAPWEM